MGSGAAEIFEFVWAHFLSISRANAQKVSFGIFITALHLTTFELLYMLIYSAERPNLACYPKVCLYDFTISTEERLYYQVSV